MIRISSEFRQNVPMGTILIRWYRSGMINRKTFMYHWANLQSTGGLYDSL